MITTQDILDTIKKFPPAPPPNLWFISSEDADEFLEKNGIERIPGINVYCVCGQDVCISSVVEKSQAIEVPHEQRMDKLKFISLKT